MPLIGCWAVAFGLVAAAHLTADPLSAALEALAHAALLLGVLAATPLRATLGELPRRYQAVFPTMLVLLVGGQFLKRGDLTYPFTSWDMYCEPKKGDPQFFDYTAAHASGREARLPIVRVVRTVAKKLRHRMDETGLRIREAPAGPERAQAVADLDAVLEAIAWRYNASHPDDPIQTVTVWDCSIPMRSLRGPSSIRREPFHETRIE